MHLNMWSPTGGTFKEIMVPLGGVALLEEVQNWGWDLSFYSISVLPVTVLCFLFVDEM